MRGKYTKIWAQKQVTKLFKTKEGVQFCKIDNVCSAKLIKAARKLNLC